MCARKREFDECRFGKRLGKCLKCPLTIANRRGKPRKGTQHVGKAISQPTVRLRPNGKLK